MGWATRIGRALHAPRRSVRTAVVTGGSRGLGLLIAEELARRGLRVVLVARDEKELARATSRPTFRSADVLAVTCDVGDADDVATLTRDARAFLGEVDIVFNVAGTILVGPLVNAKRSDFDQAMHANFFGTYNVAMAFLPGMRARGFGHIVNVASVGGRLGVPHLGPYCASKFAVAGFSDVLRAEVAQDGVRVTTVTPGLMRTGSPRQAYVKGQTSTEYGWFRLLDSLPLVSMNADRAARHIVRAGLRGDAQLVLTPLAKIGMLGQALAPDLFAKCLAVTGALLPSPSRDGAAREPKRGADLADPLTPWTILTEWAANKNNEKADL